MSLWLRTLLRLPFPIESKEKAMWAIHEAKDPGASLLFVSMLDRQELQYTASRLLLGVALSSEPDAARIRRRLLSLLASSETSTRNAAIVCLESFSDDEVTSAIVPHLKDEGVSGNVADVLRHRRITDEHAASLVEALGHDSSDVRRLAIDLLVRWIESLENCEPAVVTMLDLLTDNNRDVRASASNVLRWVLESHGEKAAPLRSRCIRAVVAMLGDVRSEIRDVAVKFLQDVEISEADDVLTRLIYHDDRDIRKQSVRLLGHLPPKKALRLLSVLLEDDDVGVRADALSVLVKRPQDEFASVLIRALSDSEPLFRPLLADVQVARTVIDALGAVEDPEAIDPLLAILRTSASETQSVILSGLASFDDPRAENTVLEVLGDESSPLFTLALTALREPMRPAIKEKLSEVRKRIGWQEHADPGVIPYGRKVCRSCGQISFDTVARCPSCGAPLWWTGRDSTPRSTKLVQVAAEAKAGRLSQDSDASRPIGPSAGAKVGPKVDLENWRSRSPDAVLDLLKDMLASIPDSSESFVKDEYDDLTRRWAAQVLFQGTSSDLLAVIQANVDRLGRVPNFSSFQILFSVKERFCQVMALFDEGYKFQPIRIWRRGSNFFACGNAAFHVPSGRRTTEFDGELVALLSNPTSGLASPVCHFTLFPSGRVGGTIVSTTFNGMPELKRELMIQRYLESKLPAEKLGRVATLLLLTPEENRGS